MFNLIWNPHIYVSTNMSITVKPRNLVDFTVSYFFFKVYFSISCHTWWQKRELQHIINMNDANNNEDRIQLLHGSNNVSTERLKWCPVLWQMRGKNVMSNIACARCQRYTNDSVFWLAQMTLCIVTSRNFPPFVEPNVKSDGPTSGLSIR